MRVETALLALAIGSTGVGAVGAVGAAGAGCGDPQVICVGVGADYQDIQHAVDAAGPGDTVRVLAGRYPGFRVRRGGSEGRPLQILADRDVVIDGTEPFSQESIYLENVSWVVLDGFTVERHGMPGFGIGAHDARPERPARGLVIRNNVVRDSDSTNIYVSQAADSVIEGNVATGSRTSHGIYLANAGSDNTVVRGNNCHDNAKNGIHFNGDLASTGDGLQRGLTIEGNVLYGNRANGLNLDGVQASTIRNNLVFRNGRHALRAYAIDGAAGPERLTIVNNTFVANGGWAVKLTEDGGGHTIFNNILLSRAGSLVVANRDVASDHNVAPGPFSVDGERTVLGLERWRALGLDRASLAISAAALFGIGGDYRLAEGSPARTGGVRRLGNAQAPLLDLLGHPRRSEHIAMGAFATAHGTPRSDP